VGSAGRNEERKTISVVFVDLVGFTAAAEELDPEDVRALQGPYWQRVRADIERHGGTVEKFIGDAVVGLFGAPVAHEDDPERAVRAALTVRDWAREQGELQVRVGVTTGEALVRVTAKPLAGEGMASGDVINTASRLQGAADANAILVDERTRRATVGVIDFRDAGSVLAKGKTERIAAWEALQARSRADTDAVQHLRAPLVGREGELELLQGALVRVRKERSPQLVTLVGVPGIGKSRLIYELMKVVDAERELVIWRQGRSLPYGNGVSFWALAEIVKAQAGILESDSGADAAAKLARAVHTLVEDASDAEWVSGHLQPLVGLAGDTVPSEGRQQEAAAAWRRFLEALAESRPAVLVFEDVHWADDGLLDFVDGLADWIRNVPLLVVATSRPELLERRPNWAGGKPNATTLSLSPLSRAETIALLRHLIGERELAPETEDALFAYADGNALYAEQYARLWRERGTHEQLPPPETVQGVIAGRLDALPPVEKSLLQNAAVLGKVFWHGALLALDGIDDEDANASLRALERKEFVQRTRRSAVEGHPEYAFQHVLLRDGAYAQIPRAVRAEKHERAARWIESLGRPEDHAELLAHHYVVALELAAAAGRASDALTERARRSLVDAGDRAAAVTAFASAASHYERALELIPADDPERPFVLFALAEELHMIGDERRSDLLEQARAALLGAGDRDRAAETEAMLAAAAWYHGRRADSFAHLEKAVALVRDATSESAKARVLAQAARQNMYYEEFQAAIEVGSEALAIAERTQLDELRADSLVTIGTARGQLRDAGGIDDVEQGLSLALSCNALVTASRACNNLAFLVSRLLDDRQRARRLLEEGLAISERIGNREMAQFQRVRLAGSQYANGEWNDAVEALDRFIAECEAGREHVQEGLARQLRAQIRTARDDFEGATKDMKRALEHGRAVENLEGLHWMLAVFASLNVELGRTSEAKKLVDELLVAPASVPVLLSLEFVLAAEELGIVGELRRHAADVEIEYWWLGITRAILDGRLVEAVDLATSAGAAPLFLAEIRLRAARKLAEQGDVHLVAELLAPALDFFRSVGATRYIRDAEEVLGRLPERATR
jgi:predicted ATPase/class 3 adenylate cyclase